MNAETIGKLLDEKLGEEKAKNVLEDLAKVIADHGLVHNPKICEKLFTYMISVTRGWNSV